MIQESLSYSSDNAGTINSSNKSQFLDTLCFHLQKMRAVGRAYVLQCQGQGSMTSNAQALFLIHKEKHQIVCQQLLKSDFSPRMEVEDVKKRIFL
jgi:hypothetical protein